MRQRRVPALKTGGQTLSRLVRAEVQMFHQQPPVMCGHLAIVLFRNRIDRLFGAPLEHLGLFSEVRCLAHSHLTPPSNHLRTEDPTGTGHPVIIVKLRS